MYFIFKREEGLVTVHLFFLQDLVLLCCVAVFLYDLVSLCCVACF